MKKFVIIAILGMFVINCADKIQAARISSLAISSGIELAQTGLNVAVIERKKACLKLHGSETTPAYQGCYNESREVQGWNFYVKLQPQLRQAVKVLNAAINAAEANGNGNSVDFVTPIKQGVCLLSKLVVWLPAEWQAKVDLYVKLVGNYTCDKSTSINPNITIYHAKRLRNLLNTMVL